MHAGHAAFMCACDLHVSASYIHMYPFIIYTNN